jgi:hypothetical protein
MTCRNLGLGLAATTAVLVGIPYAASAQPAPYLAGAKGWEDMTSGISGVWKMQGYRGSTDPPRERIARTVDGQIPPMLPWAKNLLEKRVIDAEHDKLFANMAAQCLPQGVPYMLFAAVSGPIQILETPGQITLISEEFNEIWMIPLGGKHASDPEPTFHGDSVAHWEGDTLAVDTVGLTKRTTLDQIGMPHSDALHVITRIRRIDADTLQILVNIDDPETFSTPWLRSVIYKKAPAGERVFEEICENQRNPVGADGYQSFITK